MFKSKSSEPTVEISIQAIQEDMLTFAHTNLNNVNRKRIIEDISSNNATNDIDTNLWFTYFNVFQSQNKDLERNLNKLQEHRKELESKKSEIKSQQQLLKNEIETCLENVRKAKSPE